MELKEMMEAAQEKRAAIFDKISGAASIAELDELELSLIHIYEHLCLEY